MQLEFYNCLCNYLITLYLLHYTESRKGRTCIFPSTPHHCLESTVSNVIYSTW